ncbi:MAG: hypothetical protein ACO1O1_07475 [Adhaeribacter sp.]
MMLVERYGFPGGTSTQMLDTFYAFFTPGEKPKKIVAGLGDYYQHIFVENPVRLNAFAAPRS